MHALGSLPHNSLRPGDHSLSRPGRIGRTTAARSREAAVLLLCVRTGVSREQTLRLSQLVADGIDWQKLIAIATKHRVLPLVHRTLSAACSEAIPEAVRRPLNSRITANSIRNQQLAHETARLCRLAESAGITAVAFKGPPLAIAAYGDGALRQSWDIDLLVAEQDAAAFSELLAQERYEPGRAFDRAQDHVHSDSGIGVDLHWGLTPRFFPVDADVRGLLARRSRITIDGNSVPVPSAEDMLFILCLQVAKDCWERRQHLEYLAKAVDIAEFLRASPAIDWPLVHAAAEREGWLRILHFGLALASDLLGASLPPRVQERVAADPTARRLATAVCRRLFQPEDQVVFKLAAAPFTLDHRSRQLRFYLAMRERPIDWVRHFVEIGRAGVPRMLSAWNAPARTRRQVLG